MQINSFSSTISSYNQSLMNGQKAMQQISSGKKINSAADDPAVLAILSQMQGQIAGLDQADSNTQQSIDLMNTAEGAMSDSTDIIQSMRDLAVQAGDGTLTDQDRSAIQQQMNQYAAQLDNNANYTQYNGINTNDGSLTNFTTQVGANSGQTTSASIGDTSSTALGIDTNVSTQAAALNSLQTIDNGLQQVSSARADIGAVTNGLETSGINTSQSSTNLQSAASGMGDADLAYQASLFSQSNIQSYVSMMILSKQMQNQKQNTISLFA
jgi:flagellin